MASLAGRSNVCFVGNIPYDMSEEQLMEIFTQVGRVTALRLVFDKETGKPKGYGFCEYVDPQEAEAAVRNLHNYEINGRNLRVDFAESDPAQEKTRKRGPGGGMPGAMSGMPPMPMPMSMPTAGLPPNLPPGVPLPPGTNATDSISQTLATMPPNQLLDILTQMKGMVTSNPNDARTLLNTHPQLAYALFQAMLMMNVVDASILQRMLSQVQGHVPPPPQPQMQAPPPQNYQYPPPPKLNQPVYQQPQQQPQQQQQSAPSSVQEQQKQLLMQVLAMTPQQIDALPPDQRNQILALRAQVMGAQGQGQAQY